MCKQSSCNCHTKCCVANIQHFAYQLMVSMEMTSLVANEALQPCQVALNTPWLRHTLILCFHLCPCNTEISTSAQAFMIILYRGSWNVSRYIHDCVQVWLQQNILLGCSLASFYLKRLRHSLHDSIQCWSLHCLVACIIAFFPQFLCCALNWQMLAIGLSSRSRLLEWRYKCCSVTRKMRKLNPSVILEVVFLCL